jgi:hypothetical protein
MLLGREQHRGVRPPSSELARVAMASARSTIAASDSGDDRGGPIASSDDEIHLLTLEGQNWAVYAPLAARNPPIEWKKPALGGLF